MRVPAITGAIRAKQYDVAYHLFRYSVQMCLSADSRKKLADTLLWNNAEFKKLPQYAHCEMRGYVTALNAFFQKNVLFQTTIDTDDRRKLVSHVAVPAAVDQAYGYRVQLATGVVRDVFVAYPDDVRAKDMEVRALTESDLRAITGGSTFCIPYRVSENGPVDGRGLQF